MACLASAPPRAVFPAIQGKPFVETIPGSLVKFEMIRIPAGKVTIADPAAPGKVQAVDIKSIWVGKTEVTWDMYDIYAFRLDLPSDMRGANVDAESRPSKPYGAPDRGYGHAGYAALSMTHNSATMFCAWLTKKTGRKYRLATEAEWEYACRAGQVPPETQEALNDAAWNRDNADDAAQPVAKKKANAWGLHDMLGNTTEWTNGLDGKAVTCGGSFRDKIAKVSPSARQYYTPEWQAMDAHTPKSKWWLSDGIHVGMRIVADDLN